jgi:hypothetical protein
MRLNIGNIPGIGDLAVVRPRAVVGLSLHNISFGAEDGLVGGGGVHEHCVWAVAEDGPFEKGIVSTDFPSRRLFCW